MNKKIVFTGGGTAGHVTPNLALMSVLKTQGNTISYIGSPNSIESTLVKAAGIPFYGVASGKLRRYFSLQNFIDPFKILWGIIQSYRLLSKLNPDLVFSKGGFVAVPVVVAAWLRGIPIVAHESDLSAGLANKLTFPFVKKICVTFEEGKKQFNDSNKVVVTGTPIRQSLFEGEAKKGLSYCGFDNMKPCILVMGGSLGAKKLNDAIRSILDELLKKYQIIHICGKDKCDPALVGKKGYQQFEYIDAELADLFKASSLVISRAGANALYELLALKKPHILVPLSKKVSRGDQIQNAAYFESLGVSMVLNDDIFNESDLMEAIEYLFTHQTEFLEKIEALDIQSGTEKVISVIQATS